MAVRRAGSPAVRKFRPGGEILYVYEIYNAHFDSHGHAPQVEARTRVFREGREIFTAKPNAVERVGQANPKRIATGGELRLGSAMKPGEYVLQ